MPSKSNTSDNFKTTITCARTSGTALNSSAPDIDPATSGPKQASSAWHEFSVAAKRLFKHSHVYADIERTMNQQQAMETELQTQKERISSLESSRQERIKEFELRYDEWNEEKTALLRHNERVKIEMTAKHAEEMREVKAELDAERERANTLNKRLDRASSEVNLTQKELDICNERLKEWDRYTSLLIDVDFELL